MKAREGVVVGIVGVMIGAAIDASWRADERASCRDRLLLAGGVEATMLPRSSPLRDRRLD